ncbi:hypothetical protein Vretimale_18968 [Volvox reticuliferus]|uniref:Uncharacterized protein n=1 Tax=Volvox reticuliferus TaxID=1737510 RepID=A0A8J4GY45_9CHLO|nr:hypothetical protein Vretifemale_20089 [Volvox reticuliferus]GIM16359.1 hypothetical protein Vretimale_18968 [Volvox reticuliferus]
MKALSLHGPWAFYERKAAENERRIADLEEEVLRWKSQHDELQQKLKNVEAERKQLQDVQLPGLIADKGRSQGLIDSLQAELATERLERAEEHRHLTMEVSSLTQELQKLSADNAVLRSELAKTVHQKQLTSSKLEQIRKKLGLSESEAKAFIQELDEAKAASKALREENKELAADNTHLKQQVESRSQHCMTLIGENKRLLEQVAELRMQLQKQQGELWQAKTEQQNAMAAARQLQQQQGPGRRPPQAVVREWSEPGPAGITACKSVESGGARPAVRLAEGKQNRPPWSDTGSGKTGTTGATKPVVHIPVGVRPLGATDTAKAGVVRQALTVRNQRLVSAQQQPQQQKLDT